MKSHEETAARLALYRHHTVSIPASNGKTITEKLLKHWDELRTVFNYFRVYSLEDFTHELTRREFSRDPKGESFIKYIEYSYYRLNQEDLKLRMGYTSSYGYYSSDPMTVSFNFDYYRNDEHQFGIWAPHSNPQNLIRELELRSMDHTEAELVVIGSTFQKILGDQLA